MYQRRVYIVMTVHTGSYIHTCVATYCKILVYICVFSIVCLFIRVCGTCLPVEIHEVAAICRRLTKEFAVPGSNFERWYKSAYTSTHTYIQTVSKCNICACGFTS